MGKFLSLYLNGVRFIASLLVFIYHMGYFAQWRVPVVGNYGNEAVIEFFILSGFVISYTAQNRHPDFLDYMLSRLARLWSIAIPAIILTCLLDHIGEALAPAVYAPLVPYSTVKWIIAGLVNGVFLSQFWSFGLWPGSNGPYWSIAYEFWYYVLFGIAFYGAGRRRAMAMIGALLLAGPKIVAAFPVWLIGAALRKALPSTRRLPAPLTGVLIWCASAILLVAFIWWDAAGQLRALFPALAAMARRTWEVDFLPESYLLGLILGLNLYGVMLISGAISRVATSLDASVSVLAQASFGIYLFHYPVGYCVKAVLWSQGITSGAGYVAAIYGVSFAISFGLGFWLDPLRRPMLGLLRRCAAAIPLPSALRPRVFQQRPGFGHRDRP